MFTCVCEGESQSVRGREKERERVDKVKGNIFMMNAPKTHPCILFHFRKESKAGWYIEMIG